MYFFKTMALRHLLYFLLTCTLSAAATAKDVRVEQPSQPLKTGVSSTKNFVVKLINDSGKDVITIDSIRKKSGSEDFKIAPINLPQEIGYYAPDNFKNIPLTFQPKNPGNTSAEFIIYVHDPSYEKDSLIVTVYGIGEPAQPKFEVLPPNEVFFNTLKPGEEQIKIVRIINRGNDAGYIFPPPKTQIENGNPAFTIVKFPDFNQPVKPNGIVEFHIRFSAFVPGSKEDRLIVEAAGGALHVKLHGIILPPERLKVQPKESFGFMPTLVGTSRLDTVVIYNPNKTGVMVNNMRIERDDKNHFELVSESAFMLPAETRKQVVLKFTPLDTARLPAPALRPMVRFESVDQGYEIRIDSAKGVYRKVGVSSFDIDFKDILIGKDSTAEITLFNDNPTGINAWLLKSPGNGFSFVEPVDTLRLAANSSRTVLIRFTPALAEEYSDEIRLRSTGETYTITLRGRGFSSENPGYTAHLQLNNITVAVGDSFSLPVLLKENSPVMQPGSQRRFRIEVGFTASTLYPIGFLNAPIEAGERILTKDSVYTSSSGEDLLKIPFMAVLGDMPMAHVRIKNFTWLNNAGQPLQTDFTSSSAIVSITGTEGRLVNSNKGALALSASPNPAMADIRLELANYTTGATLKIFNTAGTLVRDLTDRITYGAQPLLITFPSSEIPEGAYFCRLTSGGDSIVRTIFVQRN